jgi:dihydroceramidase
MGLLARGAGLIEAPRRGYTVRVPIGPAVVGFWGAPTSSVDWCEANYEHSPYICEFFNTLTSFAMVLAGIAGIVVFGRTLERRFVAAFVALAAVGFGSAAYHATLKFELQMLDELPMLYLALIMVYILVDDLPTSRLRRIWPWILSAHGVLVTILSAATRGRLQFWTFQISFGSLEGLCLWRVWMLHRRSHSPGAHRLFWIGMSSYLAGIAVWFVDIRFCSALRNLLAAHAIANPQLHAVWHVLASVGFFCLLSLIAGEKRSRQPSTTS